MNEKANKYFFDQLLIDPVYEPEPTVIPAVWEFSYRFNSLYRYWINVKSVTQLHVSMLESVKPDGSAEFEDVFSETAGVDIEFMPNYLRLSTISFALAIVENLLSDLSVWAAGLQGKEVRLPAGKMPYINKYLAWLIKDCGLNYRIDSTLMESLDALRKLRNGFLHKLSRDVPQELSFALSQVLADISDDANPVTDELVERSFERLADFVKSVELACEELA